MGYFKNNFLPLLGLALLLLMIPVTVDLGQRVSRLLSEAGAVPANIIVDAGIAQGSLPRPWEGVAQGGELEQDMKTLISILPITGRLQNLNIKYVRFDHIFNFPLEDRMREIRAISALGGFPVISLSYYPADVAKSWTGRPYNWSAWEADVTSLITRISRETPNVYYEVWNEPDGKDFGNMNPTEYLTLYKHTVAAANRVNNVQPFRIGGPALANPDNKNWMKQFVAGVAANNLRLDFISWHRYHKDPQVFTRDLDFIDDLLFANNLSDRERLITEWGTDPVVGPIHLGTYEAAHFAAVTRKILDRVKVATKFEARDGLAAGGGLGIFTYNGGEKPITVALRLLSKMSGNR
ncbi:MAG: glycosyl hydrolase, partial [Patescibacteria group bacterium]